MAKATKKTKSNRTAAIPAPTVREQLRKLPYTLVTISEARGEAAYILVYEILRQIPQSLCRKIMAAAYVHADDLDIPAVTEEIECLFRSIKFDIPCV